MKQRLYRSRYFLLRTALVLFLTLLVISELACSAYNTIENLSRLEFKIVSTEDIELVGVPLKGKKGINDFNAIETLKLSTAFMRNSLPLTLTINVEAKNPNDGTGCYPRTNVTIVSFPWRLFIDDKETATGNVGSEVVVPDTGETTEIPLKVNFDLFRFFKDRGYEGMLNLALRLEGQAASPLKIVLYAQPTVRTELGEIKYPNDIKIINFEYSK
jgi:hypothetical protein